KHGNFNTVSGPMIEDQMRQFFDWKDELPEVGFYYDIDYWLKPKKEQSESEILRTIGSFCKEGWERHNRLKHLIMGE
ncbi:MAG: hypothetical protein KJS98_20545, partial [Nitrospirae bacterium]|nr:hypothetical protein [Nitrospirota bacterium]